MQRSAQDIRALAGLPVGRVGSLFSPPPLSLSLFCSVFLFISSRPPLFSPSRNISLARPFHLPRYLSLAPPRPLLLLQPKVLLLLLLSYAARHHHLSRSGGGHSPLLGHHGRSPIVARQKDANFNSILSNIIYVCTRIENPAHFKPSPPPSAAKLPSSRGGEREEPHLLCASRDESAPCAAFGRAINRAHDPFVAYIFLHADFFSVLRGTVYISGKYSWRTGRFRCV